MVLNQYQVIGRKRPTDTDPAPAIFRMHLFSPNEVIAKSRFWCVAAACACRRCLGAPRPRAASSPAPAPRRASRGGLTPPPPNPHRYFLHQLHKLKKSTGEILSVNHIREKNSNIVKNYGITLRYNSRSGTHNMYKEYRDTSLTGAVEAMYADLAGRHRARFSSIQIVDTKVVKAGVRASRKYNPEIDGGEAPEAVVRDSTKQFAARNVRFPLPHRIQRAPLKSLRTTYAAKRPTTFFH